MPPSKRSIPRPPVGALPQVFIGPERRVVTEHTEHVLWHAIRAQKRQGQVRPLPSFAEIVGREVLDALGQPAQPSSEDA